jgi:hypothetical protein
LTCCRASSELPKSASRRPECKCHCAAVPFWSPRRADSTACRDDSLAFSRAHLAPRCRTARLAGDLPLPACWRPTLPVASSPQHRLREKPARTSRGRDGAVGVGVFPAGEEVLVSSANGRCRPSGHKHGPGGAAPWHLADRREFSRLSALIS